MADDAHDMGLIALLVDGVAHRFAVDGEALVFFAIEFVPALQGAVEFHWIDADEQIADDVFARHEPTTLFATAAETLSRLGSEAFGPVRDGLVTAHPTQGCPGGDRQYGGKWMASSLGSTRVGDIGKKIG